MYKKLNLFLSALLAAVMLLTLTAPAALASDGSAAREKRVVRVAYPIQQNLSQVDEYGNYSGYLTDYLNMIAEFAGWEVVYVTYSAPSLDEQMMQALDDVESGEADLLGGLLYSEALEENLLYSENSCGAVYTTLETLDSNETLKDSNYMEKDSLRVATLKNATTRNGEVAAFAASAGLTCEYIPCETVEEQLAAIKNGSADALVNVSLTFLPGMKTLAKFSPRPFYFVTGTGNEELMAELDAGIEKINRTDPYFESRLQSKYSSKTLSHFDLSDDERSYVSEQGKIEVLVCPRHAPFSFIDSEGTLCGIGISIMDEIGRSAGIEIN